MCPGTLIKALCKARMLSSILTLIWVKCWKDVGNWLQSLSFVSKVGLFLQHCDYAFAVWVDHGFDAFYLIEMASLQEWLNNCDEDLFMLRALLSTDVRILSSLLRVLLVWTPRAVILSLRSVICGESFVKNFICYFHSVNNFYLFLSPIV